MGLILGGVPPHDLILDSQSVSLCVGGNPPIKVWPTGPTIEVHEVSLTDVRGSGAIHPLLTVTVPVGETWNVRIQGTVTKAGTQPGWQPLFRIGAADSGPYGPGAAVDFSGVVTSTATTIAMVTRSNLNASFVGTVTIEK